MEMNPQDVIEYTIGTKEGYAGFIMRLRRALRPHVEKNGLVDILNEPSGNYPVLRRQSATEASWRHIKLQAVEGLKTFETTLAIQDDNVYCKGFKNQAGVWYELSENALPREWGPVQKPLEGCWGVRYAEIQGVENWKQVKSTLGGTKMGKSFAKRAVRRLAGYNPVRENDDNRPMRNVERPMRDDERFTRLALMGLIVMVCESARMNLFLHTFVGGWDMGTELPSQVADYMVNWKNISTGLLMWREYGYKWDPVNWKNEPSGLLKGLLKWKRDDGYPVIQSAGHALAPIHLVLNSNLGGASSQNKDKSSQHGENLKGKSKQAMGPTSESGDAPGPSQPKTKMEWRPKQGQGPSQSQEDENDPDPSQPSGEDDRQGPADQPTQDESVQDPGHPVEDESSQGPGQPGEDESSQGPDQPGEEQGLGETSEDDDSTQEGCGRPRVEIFAVGVNFHVTDMAITVFDGIQGQIIYLQKQQGEQQKNSLAGFQQPEALEEMKDYLVLTGPYRGISAYGNFAIQVDMPAATGGEGEPRSSSDAGLSSTWEWDCYDPKYAAQVDASEPMKQEIHVGLGRKIEVTYLVMSNAVEATMEVKLRLEKPEYLPNEEGEDFAAIVDEGSKYTAQGIITAEIGGLEKYPILLFTSEEPIPLESLNLPLARSAVQVPEGRRLRNKSEPDHPKAAKVDFIMGLFGGDFLGFIQKLRQELAMANEANEVIIDQHGVKHPVLMLKPSDEQQWIHIQLQVMDYPEKEMRSTTLAVRADICYVVGFATQGGVWYDLGNRRGSKALPEEYNSVLLDWGVSYIDILDVNNWDIVEQVLDRAGLGQNFAMNAVRMLSCFPDVEEDAEYFLGYYVSRIVNLTRLALAGLSIMVCESARFDFIRDTFARFHGMTEREFTREKMLRHIRRWGYVSRALLQREKDRSPWPKDPRLEAMGISGREEALQKLHLVFRSGIPTHASEEAEIEHQ